MIKKFGLILVILIVLLIGSGFAVYRTLFGTTANTTITLDQEEEAIVPVDSSVTVDILISKTKDSTVVLSIKELGNNYVSLEYELTYDTLGIIQGVNNGKDPVDISGKELFDREIYLGTCSGTKCTPHKGVKKISLVLQLIDNDGKKSQLSKDYEL